MSGHRLLLSQAGTKCRCLCRIPGSGLRVRIGRKVNGIATTVETGEVFQGKGSSPCFQYCLSGKLPLPGITCMS